MSIFDQQHERRQTNSVKWDSIASTYHKDNLLPLWVADMDFTAPSCVQEALLDYVKQGIYGYTLFGDDLYEAIINWQKRRHHYDINKEEILFSPGVVPSIAVSIEAFTKPGDSIMIHDPVYPPFAKMIEENKRKLIRSPLKVINGHFEMDLNKMESKMMKENVKLFILCNPHNPGGRVWTKSELKHLGDLCKKYNCLVVSDEIHQDLIFAPHQHETFHNVDADFADFSIVLTAATKTFNLSGIKNSMIFVKNPQLKAAFAAIQEKSEQDTINTFGLIGTKAAYNGAEAWLTELLDYLQKNSAFTINFLQKNLPKVKVMRPEGTYLFWLDFSAYNLTESQLNKKMIEEAGVVLNGGYTFGPSGKQHMRLNIACPKATLQQGLTQIAQAFKE